MNIEDIKRNYSQFSDAKIENIAASKAQSLPKEVVAILNEEIKKRNLSSSLETDFEAIDQQRKEANESARQELIHGHQIFHEKQSQRTRMMISLGLMVFIVIPLLSSLIDGMGMILKVGGLVFGAYTLFKYIKEKPVLVETFDKYMIVTQNPMPYKIGKIRMLISMFNMMHNNLNKVNVKYENIQRVYQNESIWSSREIMIAGHDEIGTPFELASAFHLLEEPEKVYQILKAKGVKVELEA